MLNMEHIKNHREAKSASIDLSTWFIKKQKKISRLCCGGVFGNCVWELFVGCVSRFFYFRTQEFQVHEFSMEFWYRVFMLCGEKKTKPQIVNNKKEEKKLFVDSQFSVFSFASWTNFMWIVVERKEKSFSKEFLKKGIKTKSSWAIRARKCDHKQNWARGEDTKNNYCTSLDLIFNLKFNFMAFSFSVCFFSSVPSPPSLDSISFCLVARSLCLFISSLDFFSAIK